MAGKRGVNGRGAGVFRPWAFARIPVCSSRPEVRGSPAQGGRLLVPRLLVATATCLTLFGCLFTFWSLSPRRRRSRHRDPRVVTLPQAVATLRFSGSADSWSFGLPTLISPTGDPAARLSLRASLSRSARLPPSHPSLSHRHGRSHRCPVAVLRFDLERPAPLRRCAPACDRRTPRPCVVYSGLRCSSRLAA